MHVKFGNIFQIKDATPMELQIKSLQKSITSTQEQVQQTEQLWLRDQAELVKLLKSKSKEEESMENYKNEITIFTQKLMRMEGFNNTLFIALLVCWH